MPSLKDKLKGLPQRAKQPAACAWRGPCEDGVTQSLLSRYCCCKHRFKLLVIDGLRPTEDFNHRTAYGSMWHVCEEAFAVSGNPIVVPPPGIDAPWMAALKRYCRQVAQQFPMQSSQIEHWYNVCRLQFPHYVSFWAKHPDVVQRVPLLQEYVFKVPYKLPSGRVVWLRGKFDSVDAIGGKKGGVYIMENKAKGDIVEQQIKRQLTFDLQTMTYLTALKVLQEQLRNNHKMLGRRFEGHVAGLLGLKDKEILGVRYNVIRRPLSGGKDSIRQHKPSKGKPQGESSEEFYNRLSRLIGDECQAAIAERRDCHYFMRWKVEVSPQDIAKFQDQCLEPLLENLCDDYEWWQWCHTKGHNVFDGQRRCVQFPQHCPRHLREPHGIYDPIKEGRSSELDEYLQSGSTLGLERVTDLFRELN